MVIEEFKARPSVAMASASVNAFHECLLCAVEFDSVYKNGSMESRSVTAGNHGAKRRAECSTTRSEFTWTTTTIQPDLSGLHRVR